MADIILQQMETQGNKRERKKHRNFFTPSVSEVLFGHKRSGRGEFRDEYPNVPIGIGKHHGFFLDTSKLARKWADEPTHKVFID